MFIKKALGYNQTLVGGHDIVEDLFASNSFPNSTFTSGKGTGKDYQQFVSQSPSKGSIETL